MLKVLKNKATVLMVKNKQLFYDIFKCKSNYVKVPYNYVVNNELFVQNHIKIVDLIIVAC